MIRAWTEGSFDSDRHIGTKSCPAVEQIGQGGACHPKNSGRLCHADPERLNNVSPDKTADMRRIFHDQDEFFSLMVVDIVDIDGIPADEIEHYAPIPGYSDGPLAFEIALELM